MISESLDLPQPRSAWLLVWDDESYPPANLDSQIEGEFACGTACPHVEVGDTLFFYYMAPRKTISFIGRAMSRPYVDANVKISSKGQLSKHQWLVDYGAVVEIEPIPYQAIRKACGILRGRSGKPIPTEAANQLLRNAAVVYPEEGQRVDRALQQIVGRSDLPAPMDVDLNTLRDLPASLLRLEKEVEEYIVEPLARLLRLPEIYSLKRRLRIGRKVADYAILKEAEPHCIVEAKLRTSLDRERNWAKSPDVNQALGYADNFGIGFIVVDCEEIFCFGSGSSEPRLCFVRRELTAADIKAIRSFVIASSN
ncbi:MAG: hypothetical protein IH991_08895 [Planctomycetes bacterium]|nr:hypothetical protein [Planctomycetota bacterium]